MQLKLGVVNQDDRKPERVHLLVTAKERKTNRSDAFCNLPAVVKYGTRPATRAERTLPKCGLCIRGAVKAGHTVP
jgi:hypothetical protein